MTQTIESMMAAANAVIGTVGVHDARAWLDEPGVTFVDVRDAAERHKSGSIPGAISAPRGHLEFYADPSTAIHKPELRSAEKLVVYCATGGRSTLAAKTLIDMGIANVINLAGGFAAWSEAGGPIEPIE